MRSSTEGSVIRRPSSSRYSKPLPRRRRLSPGPEQSTRLSRATDRQCPRRARRNQAWRTRGAAYPGSMPRLAGRPLARPARRRDPSRGAAARAGRSRDREDAHAHEPLRLARGAGRARRGDLGAHLLLAGGGRDARAPRGADRVPLRGASTWPRSTPSARGCSRTRRSRPGVDPFFVAGHARGPAGAAARPDRRADAPPPRDPRQPGAAAGQLRGADRPPEGRDGDRRGLPPPRRAARGGGRGRRRRRAGAAPRASSSSRGSTPTTTACSPSAARSTSATS